MCKGQKGGENGAVFVKNGMNKEKKVKKGEKYGSIFLIIWQKMNSVSQWQKGEENGSISAVYELEARETDKMPYGAWYPYGILLDFKAYCQGSSRLIPPKSLSWSGQPWLSDRDHFPSGP